MHGQNNMMQQIFPRKDLEGIKVITYNPIILERGGGGGSILQLMFQVGMFFWDKLYRREILQRMIS